MIVRNVSNSLRRPEKIQDHAIGFGLWQTKIRFQESCLEFKPNLIERVTLTEFEAVCKVTVPYHDNEFHIIIYLAFETMKNLGEHLLQISFRMNPGGDCVAKEDEIRDYSTRIHADHRTDSTKR